jgi:bifunctional non-homologous end joining protein LigD
MSITRTRSRSSAGAKSKPLAEYKQKRDFTRTAEPAGKPVASRSRRALHFVIQKHAARNLHFDFRLELDGVMKSWAVPKGPSYDPAVKRLAMEVEDHPIEYNTFEGTIPKGQYGGGTVMLWDRGTYEPEGGGGDDALREGYERGDLKFILHGKRLEGGWVLVRMRRGEGERAQWLLIKHRDASADRDYDVTAEVTTSVTSGRTMEEIATRSERVWNSNRDGDVTPGPGRKRTATRKTRRSTTTATRKTSAGRTARKKAASKTAATAKSARRRS